MTKKAITQSMMGGIILSLIAFSACVVESGGSVVRAVSKEGVVSKIIFVTVGISDGNAGGIAGADAKCMADVNYPGSGTYKVLAADGTNRVASVSANKGDGQVDWVLQANTSYARRDGTALMTTDSNGLFVFGTMHNSWDGTITFDATGLSDDWTGDPNNCRNWTSNSSEIKASGGFNSSTGSGAIAIGSSNCSNTAHLICVEQ
ncbi:MAG: hypothetical protein IEMM0008_1337 [bacterium]|nr:MAG: hypothetical protein IEMM0008_1337 [bacterium]